MIDYQKLQEAYENEGFYSLQLEVGDLCFQGCIYCYMNALEEEKNTLSDAEIGAILRDAKSLGITAIEWLGGEPLLRNTIFEHMAMAADLGFRNNVWTGGLPLSDREIRKRTMQYARRGLIAFHLSTVNPRVYKILHPSRTERDLDTIVQAVRDVLDEGYPPSQILNSVTFTGLQSAEDMIETIDYFESEMKIKTSLNIYHTYLRPGIPPGELARFIPERKEVAKVYARWAGQWGKKQLPMNCVDKQYCCTTLAVLCDGNVTPCATIREKDAPNIHSGDSLYRIATELKESLTFKRFRDKDKLPPDCQNCRLEEECFGCRSRAYASGAGLYGKDPGCFRKIPQNLRAV